MAGVGVAVVAAVLPGLVAVATVQLGAAVGGASVSCVSVICDSRSRMTAWINTR